MSEARGVDAASSEQRNGLLLAVGAYLIWGFLPLYVALLHGIAAFELIGWRILSSLVVIALLLTVTRSWSQARATLRQPRTVLWLFFAGIAIVVNWTVFSYAALTGHVLETSLGYFLNPIVSIVFGVAILGERLRRWQWVAVGISAVAMIVMIVGYGSVPWIALTLAASFGTYGLLKKQVGSKVTALTGFAIETTLTLPWAVVLFAVSVPIWGFTAFELSGWAQLAIAGFGILTAVPLLLFAAAARRISLVALGFTQYLAPSISFVVGVAVMGEPMPLERWVGFGLVWLSIAVLTIDLVVAERSRARMAATVVAPTP